MELWGWGDCLVKLWTIPSHIPTDLHEWVTPSHTHTHTPATFVHSFPFCFQHQHCASRADSTCTIPLSHSLCSYTPHWAKIVSPHQKHDLFFFRSPLQLEQRPGEQVVFGEWATQNSWIIRHMDWRNFKCYQGRSPAWLSAEPAAVTSTVIITVQHLCIVQQCLLQHINVPIRAWQRTYEWQIRLQQSSWET